ncbi:hypothetical protein EDF57_106129 [Novosphingobium sp. PhB55]|uniref:hypothetical protein n=1 Tax=Novosphingobium sp. PhB55 TaxID=2485106 RepID=UPI0010DD4D62|nr:hypothetical protein [Novosphingobium sp. PhB55]TDW63173.1 hypothetical protein EDF57_106129 [Novosphingobium sp. PhB55]
MWGDDAIPLRLQPQQVARELVRWADVIVVMEKVHRRKVQQTFRRRLNRQRMICLDIPDDYAFMDPDLALLLETRMARHLSHLPMHHDE